MSANPQFHNCTFVSSPGNRIALGNPDIDIELSPTEKRRFRLAFNALIFYCVLAFVFARFGGDASELFRSPSRLAWVTFGMFVGSLAECVAEALYEVLRESCIRQKV